MDRLLSPDWPDPLTLGHVRYFSALTPPPAACWNPARCGQGDSDDHDDILLCDYAGCFRAYHQTCLTPPIKPEAFPEEEEDWFCWQCECLTDCFEMLENEFQVFFLVSRLHWPNTAFVLDSPLTYESRDRIVRMEDPMRMVLVR